MNESNGGVGSATVERARGDAGFAARATVSRSEDFHDRAAYQGKTSVSHMSIQSIVFYEHFNMYNAAPRRKSRGSWIVLPEIQRRLAYPRSNKLQTQTTMSLQFLLSTIRELRRAILDLWVRLTRRHEVGLWVVGFLCRRAAGHCW